MGRPFSTLLNYDCDQAQLNAENPLFEMMKLGTTGLSLIFSSACQKALLMNHLPQGSFVVPNCLSCLHVPSFLQLLCQPTLQKNGDTVSLIKRLVGDFNYRLTLEIVRVWLHTTTVLIIR